MATRSPCEDQALPLRGPLPLVPRAVSPHRGNLVALSLSFIIEGRCLQAGQRHGPRRIAQHPEQSGPLPLPALTHQSPEIGKEKNKFSFSLGFHYISRLAAANIGCASEKEKTNFPFHSAFTIFAENGFFSKDEEMPAK